jgi:hypothetical protein
MSMEPLERAIESPRGLSITGRTWLDEAATGTATECGGDTLSGDTGSGPDIRRSCGGGVEDDDDDDVAMLDVEGIGRVGDACRSRTGRAVLDDDADAELADETASP